MTKPITDERLAAIRAMIALTDVGDAQHHAITDLLAEVERLRERENVLVAFVQRIADAEAFVGEWDDYHLNLDGRHLIAEARALMVQQNAPAE